MTTSENLDGSPNSEGTVTSRADIARRERSERLEHEEMLPASPPFGGLFSGTFTSIRGIFAYRELLNLLFRREVKVRYKDSVLGFLWTLIRPLAQLLVYAIAVGQFLGASRGGNDYPIYVFSGLTIWGLFLEIVAGGTGSMLGNAALIKKVYLPRELFVLSTVLSALFNFVIQTFILFLGTIAFKHPPTGVRLLYMVPSILIVLLFATAFAFVLSAVNVYLRDVQYLVEITLLWGAWFSPIIYRWSQVGPKIEGHPIIEQIYLANPVTIAVFGFQRAFWVRGMDSDTIPHLGLRMAVMIVIGIVFLWLGQRVFARLQSNFAQEI